MTHYAISSETLPGAAFDAGVDDVCASSSLRHALPTASPSRPGSFRRLTPSLAGAYLPV